MFGFIGKFKQEVAQHLENARNEVVSGFDAVHQRLVTLEAQVQALLAHTRQQAEAKVEEVKNVEAGAAEIVSAVAEKSATDATTPTNTGA